MFLSICLSNFESYYITGWYWLEPELKGLAEHAIIIEEDYVHQGSLKVLVEQSVENPMLSSLRKLRDYRLDLVDFMEFKPLVKLLGFLTLISDNLPKH